MNTEDLKYEFLKYKHAFTDGFTSGYTQGFMDGIRMLAEIYADEKLMKQMGVEVEKNK